MRSGTIKRDLCAKMELAMAVINCIARPEGKNFCGARCDHLCAFETYLIQPSPLFAVFAKLKR